VESWPQGVEDLEVAFAERFAFEQADVQLASSRSLLVRAEKLGWHIRPEAQVLSEGSARFWEGTKRPATGNDLPLVTVGMAYYNLGRYLPEALASLAGQTYPKLEVLVIDDGSTEEQSRTVFEEMSSRYPQFRFHRQANAGIGTTRNRALREAQGDYFIPMDADNVARPDMVERLVTAMRHNPDVAAMSCYFLAFGRTEDLARQRYLYAFRPPGGPHVLASLRNVYGDANAIFHTARFRAVGGFERDRATSCEDWEAFVKLIHAGQRVEVVPEHLFYYRHLETGFSRVTSPYRNHQRVLRQFDALEQLPRAERVLLWRSFVGFQRRLEHLAQENRCLGYRIADCLYALYRRLPIVKRALKSLFPGGSTKGLLHGRGIYSGKSSL
jgi:glycosyltransferase involved in cell wall biosynthesis